MQLGQAVTFTFSYLGCPLFHRQENDGGHLGGSAKPVWGDDAGIFDPGCRGLWRRLRLLPASRPSGSAFGALRCCAGNGAGIAQNAPPPTIRDLTHARVRKIPRDLKQPNASARVRMNVHARFSAAIGLGACIGLLARLAGHSSARMSAPCRMQFLPDGWRGRGRPMCRIDMDGSGQAARILLITAPGPL